MPTDIRNVNNGFTDDATYRVWALSVHDALIAAGLVQTADTGQIDFTTVVRPNNAVTAGYAIYRMNDSGQASYPIFVKVEYSGASGSPATRAQLFVTAGTGTNGAGTVVNASQRVTLSNTGTTSSSPQYTAHTEGGFFFDTAMSATTVAFYFGVQRIRDSNTGAFRPKWAFFAASGSIVAAAVFDPLTASWNGNVGAASGWWPDLGISFHIGGNATDIAMSPGLFYDGVFDYLSVLAADVDDVTLGSPFTITMPEGQRTFMALDAAGGMRRSTDTVLCIPWE